MQDKCRGQVSIFIIVGIVLLLIIGMGYYLLRSTSSVVSGLGLGNQEVSQVKNYIESCIYDELVTGAYILANKGGYIYEYNHTFDTYFEQVAYGLIDDQDVSPSLAFSESELSKFIHDHIRSCTLDLVNSSQYDVLFHEPAADTKILQNKIVADVKYKAEIIKKNKVSVISDFKVSVPIELGYSMDIRDDIISELKNENIDLNRLSLYDAEVDIMPYDSNIVAYAIVQNSTINQNRPLVFKFAVEKTPYENKEPEVGYIGLKNIYAGEVFNFNVSAYDPEDDMLTFEDRTALFDINSSNGDISFTPSPMDVGYYEIAIIVSDGINRVKKVLKLNISER